MAGGGGGSFLPMEPEKLRALVEEARAKLRSSVAEAEINDYLLDLLHSLNVRDVDLVRARLDALYALVAGDVEFERYMFGGSVAKHTYVDGLSDIDALLLLPGDAHSKPSDLLGTIAQRIRQAPSSSDIVAVEVGGMAVTVRYADGMEIQLLPALRSGSEVCVPNPRSGGWVSTKPALFQGALTRANDRLGGRLVPAIKLFKSALNQCCPELGLSGYHSEALAIAATRDLRGPLPLKDLVASIVRGAAQAVLRPIDDRTGQSSAVDDSLGPPQSAARLSCSQGLSRLARRMETATTKAEWEEILAP